MRPRTILPCYEQVNLTWARDPIGKPTLGQRSASRKHLTSMSCKLEPAIWSRGTGQRIACFNRCQLIIAEMSNIKDVHGKLRLYVSFLEYGRHVGQLCRRRRAYAPTSNTASQDNHEKINSCRRGSRGGEMGEFSPPFFWAPYFLFFLIPQILNSNTSTSSAINNVMLTYNTRLNFFWLKVLLQFLAHKNWL